MIGRARLPLGAHAVRVTFCILMLGVGPAGAVAQGTSPTLRNYLLDVWHAQDGVRLSFTSNLVQTRNGYLWLSSQSGLTRFDGVRFQVFDAANTSALRGRPSLETYPLVQDDDGTLWIGSDIGLFGYRGDTLLSPTPDSSFATDLINDAVMDSTGHVWAITRLGHLFRVGRDGTLQSLPGTPVSSLGSSMTVDASGDIWIAAGVEGVYRVHQNSITAVVFPPTVDPHDVTTVLAAPDSSIWFGTSTAVMQWKHGRFRRVPLPVQQQSRGSVSCLAFGSDSSLWIGTEGAGLYRFDGHELEHMSRASGLSDDRVISITVDRAQDVWIATRDGLNRLRPVPFAVLTERTDLPTDLPGAIVHDRAGSVWLAPPTGGLFRASTNKGLGAFHQVSEVSTGDLVTALVVGQGDRLWVGQRSGAVHRAIAGQMSSRPVVTGLPPVTDMVEDTDGTLWIGTWHGLFRLRRGTLAKLGVQDGLPDDAIHRLLRDSQGTLWAATQSGIARRRIMDAHFSTVPVPGEGASRAAVLFEAPAGTVWIGSANGLARVSGGRVALITSEQGLPENWVGAGELDAMGYLWLGQLNGLTRVFLNDLIGVADGRAPTLTTVSTYQSLDGLAGGDPTAWPHPWSFADSTGKLWFALAHGIAIVDPRRAGEVPHDPITRIEQVLIDGVRVAPALMITVNPGAHRIELRYTGVDLANGPGVRFRYRLDGFDTTWVQAGTQRAVSYTRLAAGRYRFHVASRASNGHWPTVAASTDILVLAPLYRRPWFLGAAFLILLTVLWTAHRAVLRTRLVAVRDERSRMAREIHDSLLQGFGGIALQLHAASARLALTPEQQPLLDRILALISRTLADARGVVWNLRVPDMESWDLTTACGDAAQRIMAGSGVMPRVVQRGTARRLSPAKHVEILRIAEEALTNVRKHAEATEVVVDLVYGWRGLRLTVQDNGKGVDAARLRRPMGHWGLVGMRERAGRIGGRLSLTSLQGTGMTVSVEIGYARGVFTRPESLPTQE